MNIKHILVPSDFSATAKQALANAMSIAQQQQAKITLLHIVTVYNDDPYNGEQPFPALDGYYEEMEQRAGDFFKQEMAAFDLNTIDIKPVIRRGFSVYEEILSFAGESNVDFIAMGTHSRKSVARFFLGSVAENIVHHADCPVLTVRIHSAGDALPVFKRILVPTDFYEQSGHALKLALSLLAKDGRIDFLHVVEDAIHPAYFVAEGETMFDVLPHIRDKSEETLAKMTSDLAPKGVDVAPIIKEGRIAQTILDYAREAESDLIVMGTHSMNALAQVLIGSQANKVIRNAGCPVITTK